MMHEATCHNHEKNETTDFSQTVTAHQTHTFGLLQLAGAAGQQGRSHELDFYDGLQPQECATNFMASAGVPMFGDPFEQVGQLAQHARVTRLLRQWSATAATLLGMYTDPRLVLLLLPIRHGNTHLSVEQQYSVRGICEKRMWRVPKHDMAPSATSNPLVVHVLPADVPACQGGNLRNSCTQLHTVPTCNIDTTLAGGRGGFAN